MRLSHLIRHIARFSRDSRLFTSPVSSGYRLLDRADVTPLDGWKSSTVAERQHQAFAHLVQAAREERPRQDFVVAARALAETQMSDPLVLEIGCGSGYYSEMLPLLLRRSVRYVGVDYSFNMLALGSRVYPNDRFVAGDACRLPLKTSSCDVALSGTSLMHIVGYQQAIVETARVARKWCIFHTVPVMAMRTTTLLRKDAYGGPTVEVIFNKGELEGWLAAAGLQIEMVSESLPYDVGAVVGEHTWTLTYLCRKLQAGDV